MNNIIEALHARKSTRAFERSPVLAAHKEAILRAAAAAPTPGNQQMYTIIDVTDQALKNTLAVSCDNQPFIAAAPMVLIFVADCQKWYDAYRHAGIDAHRPGPGDLALAITDASIAAQNAVVAAESLGIGSCYIGDIFEQCEMHRSLFNLPPYAVPAAMLVLGYPTEAQKARQKPARFDQKHIVHENGYRHMDADELKEMLQKRAGSRAYEEWLTAFHTRKYGADYAREMNRSVAEYLRAFLFGR